MATYLAEDQIGFDANLVGFPTLGGCMGIAIQTDAGLYGFHNPPGHTARSTELPKLYKGQPANRLITCCRWKKRYDGAAGIGSTEFLQWLDEVKEVADLIKYTGPVIGLNLSAVLGVLPDEESAYCEFGVSSSGDVTMGFSLTSNTSASTVYDLGTTVRRVAANKSTSVPYKGKVFDSISSSNGGFTMSDGKAGLYQFTL